MTHNEDQVRAEGTHRNDSKRGWTQRPTYRLLEAIKEVQNSFVGRVIVVRD